METESSQPAFSFEALKRENPRWASPKIGQPLTPNESRKFVDRDAESAPQEDFAHNLDTYLFDPEKLKEYVPAVYGWISKNLSKNFQLKRECNNGK